MKQVVIEIFSDTIYIDVPDDATQADIDDIAWYTVKNNVNYEAVEVDGDDA